MDRVETLSNLLATKLQHNASINELLNIVKMLESELLHLKTITPPTITNATSTAIHIAKHNNPTPLKATPNEATAVEEKTVVMLQVDEAEVEAELEEIKKIAEERNHLIYQNKPAQTFDVLDEIPTMVNRQSATPVAAAIETTMPLPTAKPVALNTDDVPKKEINEVIPTNNTSLNDILKSTQHELSDSLKDAPVKDLKKAIGINDRFRFLNELFRGDEAMYERSIKTINNFAIYPEAEYWIRRELKLKLGWSDQNDTVQQFDQLVKRRFA